MGFEIFEFGIFWVGKFGQVFSSSGSLFEVGIFWGIQNNLKIRDSYTVTDSEHKPRGLYFSKTLFEGLNFGGAYLRREICVSKSIGLAL